MKSADNKSLVVKLEQLLNATRKDKILYLNAADRQHLPAFKRFFNQQALLRNRLFNDLSSILSQKGIEVDHLLLRRPDIQQFMLTSPDREKKNPFKKLLRADHKLAHILEEIISIELDESIKQSLSLHYQKIKAGISENEGYNEHLEYKEVSA